MNYLKLGFLLLILLAFRYLDAQKVETLVSDVGKNFEAISWLSDGTIYVSDYANGRLYSVSLNGEVETLVTEFSNIAGGGQDDQGAFYFSGIGNGTVNRVNTDGSFTEVASGMNQPVGVVSATEPGYILVAAYGENAIYKINVATGSKSILAQNQGINGPDGLVSYDENEFLVANFNNNRIHKVSDSGEVNLFAELPVSGFAGYIARHEELFFIPSISGHKIYQIDKAGVVSELAGSGIAGSEDGVLAEATFNAPNGIAVSPGGDTLLISDGSTLRTITGYRAISSSKEASSLLGLEIGPNPCTDYIKVQSSEEALVASYEIYDASGALVGKEAIMDGDSLSIDTRGLSVGIFSLVLKMKGDRASRVLQFVKARD